MYVLPLLPLGVVARLPEHLLELLAAYYFCHVQIAQIHTTDYLEDLLHRSAIDVLACFKMIVFLFVAEHQ